MPKLMLLTLWPVLLLVPMSLSHVLRTVFGGCPGGICRGMSRRPVSAGDVLSKVKGDSRFFDRGGSLIAYGDLLAVRRPILQCAWTRTIGRCGSLQVRKRGPSDGWCASGPECSTIALHVACRMGIDACHGNADGNGDALGNIEYAGCTCRASGDCAADV